MALHSCYRIKIEKDRHENDLTDKLETSKKFLFKGE